MLFNSYTFICFFVVVYLLYLMLDHRWQNRLLLVASLVFYGWWDPRFLALILFSILLDFVCGLKIHETESARRRRAWLIISLIGNLGLLGFFKYFHFFVDSFVTLTALVGLQAHKSTLNIILPIGISFYTFQTLSYTLDIYRKRMKPTTSFLDFALFVSFFPQLLAGPIERARNLLPQIQKPRVVTPDQLREGVHLVAWGLFKKMLLADNIAPIVNHIFSNADRASTADVVLAVYAFGMQLFCDFSGYSDIARGLGKMMGFNIMINFKFPEFATRPSDFWARWHISLSTWVRDYLFVALGANRKSNLRTAFNVVLVMTVIGLWHGAAWTYVVWGFYFGVLQAGHLLLLNVLPRRRARPAWRERLSFLGNMFLCRNAIIFSMLLFRSEDWGHVHQMGAALFSGFDVLPEFFPLLKWYLIFWVPFRIYEIWQFRNDDPLVVMKQKSWVRFAVYVGIAFWGYLIYIFSASVPVAEEFIYFQF